MIATAAGAWIFLTAQQGALVTRFDEAERWQQLVTTSSGSTWYMDRATLRRTGLTTSAWLAVDHSRDRREPARQTRALIEIECAAGTFRWVQYLSYRRIGAAMPERVAPNVEASITPGSTLDEVRRGVCGG